MLMDILRIVIARVVCYLSYADIRTRLMMLEKLPKCK
jgi:hypothetical protein